MIHLDTEWTKIKGGNWIDWHDTGNTIWLFISNDEDILVGWAIDYEPIKQCQILKNTIENNYGNR